MLGSSLELRHEGPSGYRHYLNGRAVHAGTLLELLTDSGWLLGRYEWSFRRERSPYLVINDECSQAISIDTDAILRWPHASSEGRPCDE
jgi:hypothetical protein